MFTVDIADREAADSYHECLALFSAARAGVTTSSPFWMGHNTGLNRIARKSSNIPADRYSGPLRFVSGL